MKNIIIVLINIPMYAEEDYDNVLTFYFTLVPAY